MPVIIPEQRLVMFLGGMKKASTLEPLSNDFFWPLRLQTFLLFFIFDVIRAVIQKKRLCGNDT